MGERKDGDFSKLNINRNLIEKEFDIDLFLFLDAVSLGLNDKEISDLIGYDQEKVKKVRERLGNIGSEMGIYYKKDMPSN